VNVTDKPKQPAQPSRSKIPAPPPPNPDPTLITYIEGGKKRQTEKPEQ